MTQDEIAAIIQEVANNHGVTLHPEDPLLALATINKRIAERLSQDLDEKLTHFREILEAEARQHSEQHIAKTEQLLIRAIEESRNQAKAIIKEGTAGLSPYPNTNPNDLLYLPRSLQETRRVSYLAFFASVLCLITLLMIFLKG